VPKDYHACADKQETVARSTNGSDSLGHFFSDGRILLKGILRKISAEVWVRSQLGPCEIYGGRSVTASVF